MAVVLALVACASEREGALGSDRSDPPTADDGDGGSGATDDSAAGDQGDEGDVGDAAPGADGVGDPYFPQLGNGGYDVEHYDLDLDWQPDGPRLDGRVTIAATVTAEQALSSFDLDFGDLEIESAEVDGETATTERTGEHELVVTPAEPLAPDAEFTVEIAYGGEVQSLPGLLPGLGGWVDDGREVYVASQPDGAHGFYPVNDHPSDKAGYTITVTAPADLDVVANGTQTTVDDDADAGTKTWTYDAPQPMASYLVQVVIANLQFQEGISPGGVTLRHAIDEDVLATGAPPMAATGDMVDFFAERFGPYPFDVAGGVVVDEDIGFALETQTLSLFPANVTAEVVAHELAHQWFGDQVSLASWQDIWLNEGFAVYASWLWLDHAGESTMDRLTEEATFYEGLDVPPVDPGGPDHLFDATVYFRGGLTLYVLHDQMGDEAFFDLLQQWVERYGGGTATTADFEALAEEVAGQDLTPLFDAWLRSDELPRLEDWLG